MKLNTHHIVVVLAAGNSSRLGSPKQLLTIGNQTMIRNTIAQVTNLPDAPPIIVVTGHIHDEIVAEVSDLTKCIIRNKNWALGIGSSIGFAVSEALNFLPELKGILFLVSDQPYIDTALIQRILEAATEKEQKIIASKYNDTLGIPAYFPAYYFKHLQNLDPSMGAKILIEEFGEDVCTVDFEMGGIDIDTPSDYENLLKQKPLS
jgi:molybdenum cofactor cytidylyltransferase